MGRILLIIFLLLMNSGAWANSCCGQSPASFTVLSLEQALSVTTSYSYIQTQGRVFGTNDFYVWDDKKREVQSLQLNIASSLSSRQQVFLTSAFLQGSYSDSFESGSSNHLSDTQLGYTYEVLPEYSFSYWKPIIYLSGITNIPTGKSIFDNSTLSEGTDVTGYNQWAVGLGLTIRKVYYPLTVTVQAKSLRVFSKQFDQVKVSGFYDNSLALLFNYATNIKLIVLNFGVTSNQLTQRTLSTSPAPSGVLQSTTALFGLQRSFGESFSAGINYSDQTLLGRARNSILNKTYSFNINYNYF